MFINPPKELCLGPDILLKLLKFLYGLAESGDYWRRTLRFHLVNYLGMEISMSDSALFFKKVGSGSLEFVLLTLMIPHIREQKNMHSFQNKLTRSLTVNQKHWTPHNLSAYKPKVRKWVYITSTTICGKNQRNFQNLNLADSNLYCRSWHGSLVLGGTSLVPLLFSDKRLITI